MAYLDWRAFMPDPNRTKLSDVFGNLAQFLYDRQDRQRKEEEAAIDALRQQAEDERAERKLALDEQGEARLLASQRFGHINDPELRSAVQDYYDEHGAMPDSGMMRDLTSAVAMQKARREAAVAAVEDELSQKVERRPTRNKQWAMDKCIDTLIADRGGNPDDPAQGDPQDLVDCENIYEAGKRKHREELDALYTDKKATGDASIGASPEGEGAGPALAGSSAHSKSMRAKLADAITAQEVGNWEALYGASGEVLSAFHGFAADQKRKGNDYYWNIRPPTSGQQAILKPLIAGARDPMAGLDIDPEEDAGYISNLVAQQRERNRAVYLGMRPGLSVEQRANLDPLLEVDRRQRVNVDLQGNVNNREANSAAAAGQSPDQAFSSAPVNRQNRALAELTGQDETDAGARGDSIPVPAFDPDVSHADEFGTPATAQAGFVAPPAPAVAAPPAFGATAPFAEQMLPPGSPAASVNVVDRALREAGL